MPEKLSADLADAADVASPLPMVRIMVPASMRRFTGERVSLDLRAANVGAALRLAAEEHPALRGRLFAGDGSLYRFINIFVNATDIRNQSHENTCVRDGDVITIMPAIAGG